MDLFQEKWDEVLQVGEEFLAENSFIYDLNTVSEERMGDDGKEFFNMMNLEGNDEIVFTCMHVCFLLQRRACGAGKAG